MADEYEEAETGGETSSSDRPQDTDERAAERADERAAELTMAVLDDQLAYFEHHSSRAKKSYQRLRFTTLVTAAAIPVTAAADADPFVAAVLGALVVVFEGAQQVFHFHDRWIDFRTNVNALHREKRLYLARAAAYAETSRPGRLLAENFESIMQADTVSWRSSAAAKSEN